MSRNRAQRVLRISTWSTSFEAERLACGKGQPGPRSSQSSRVVHPKTFRAALANGLNHFSETRTIPDPTACATECGNWFQLVRPHLETCPETLFLSAWTAVLLSISIFSPIWRIARFHLLMAPYTFKRFTHVHDSSSNPWDRGEDRDRATADVFLSSHPAFCIY